MAGLHWHQSHHLFFHRLIVIVLQFVVNQQSLFPEPKLRRQANLIPLRSSKEVWPRHGCERPSACVRAERGGGLQTLLGPGRSRVSRSQKMRPHWHWYRAAPISLHLKSYEKICQTRMSDSRRSEAIRVPDYDHSIRYCKTLV